MGFLDILIGAAILNDFRFGKQYNSKYIYILLKQTVVS